MSLNEVLRQNLRAEMDRQGMSAYRLSKLTGVSQSLIGKVLRGEGGSSLATVENLSFGLNKKPHQLLMQRPGVVA
jgi:transcriptional regulator with XRE-family HTH domain